MQSRRTHCKKICLCFAHIIIYSIISYTTAVQYVGVMYLYQVQTVLVASTSTTQKHLEARTACYYCTQKYPEAWTACYYCVYGTTQKYPEARTACYATACIAPLKNSSRDADCFATKTSRGADCCYWLVCEYELQLIFIKKYGWPFHYIWWQNKISALSMLLEKFWVPQRNELIYRVENYTNLLAVMNLYFR